MDTDRGPRAQGVSLLFYRFLRGRCLPPFSDSRQRQARRRILSIDTQLPGGRAPPGSQKGGVPEGRGAPGLAPWATEEGKGASRACGRHPAAQAPLHSRRPRRSLEAEQAGSPCYRSPGRLSSKEVCSVPWLQGNLGAVKQAG